MSSMKDSPLDSLVVGSVLSLAGLAIIIFHKSIKEWRDNLHSKDWPIGYGEMWTGKYTRGGLIFTYAAIILFGLVLLIAGIVNLVGVFKI